MTYASVAATPRRPRPSMTGLFADRGARHVRPGVQTSADTRLTEQAVGV